ncbi:MAG: hypothetical protein M0P73_19870, partial [Syntrophobacterales bacterium]|nr:hypothetical protein [Syntrophobacterales bacterium]
RADTWWYDSQLAIHLIFVVFLPLPWWEGVGGKENYTKSRYIFTPTLTLPHQGGGEKRFSFVTLIAQ